MTSSHNKPRSFVQELDTTLQVLGIGRGGGGAPPPAAAAPAPPSDLPASPASAGPSSLTQRRVPGAARRAPPARAARPPRPSLGFDASDSEASPASMTGRGSGGGGGGGVAAPRRPPQQPPLPPAPPARPTPTSDLPAGRPSFAAVVSAGGEPPQGPVPPPAPPAPPAPALPAEVGPSTEDAVARERLAWHASLSSLLEGGGAFAREDYELAVSLARAKASDLRDQLIFWQTPPDPTWPAREQRLDWLEMALGEARDIATGLRQHGALGGGASAGPGPAGGAGVAAYIDIVSGVATELAGMARLCCDCVGEGLRATPPGSADTRRALRAGNRAVAIVADLDTRLRGLARLVQGSGGGRGARAAAAMLTVSPLPAERASSLPGPAAELEAPRRTTPSAATAAATEDIGALCAGLGDAAGRVALAALDAAGEAQAALLAPGALKPSASQSGHELSVLARTLQAAWAGAGRLVEDAATAWPAVRPTLFREWLLLFVRAAEAAAAMQRAVGVAGADGGIGGGGVAAASSALTLAAYGRDTCPSTVASTIGSDPGTDGEGDGDGGTPGSVAAVPAPARPSPWAAVAAGGVAKPALALALPPPPPSLPCDDDLQAQAWLPSSLTALLAQAEHAAAVVMEGVEEDTGRAAAAAAPPSPSLVLDPATGLPAPPSLPFLVDRLSSALYDLAGASARRVARLGASPSGLACWALELLEEQCVGAVVFVRDLDASRLGRGPSGVRHYNSLRSATDALVNAILRVRRVLRLKRAAGLTAGVGDFGGSGGGATAPTTTMSTAADPSDLPRPLGLVLSTVPSSAAGALDTPRTEAGEDTPRGEVGAVGAAPPPPRFDGRPGSGNAVAPPSPPAPPAPAASLGPRTWSEVARAPAAPASPGLGDKRPPLPAAAAGAPDVAAGVAAATAAAAAAPKALSPFEAAQTLAIVGWDASSPIRPGGRPPPPPPPPPPQSDSPALTSGCGGGASTLGTTPSPLTVVSGEGGAVAPTTLPPLLPHHRPTWRDRLFARLGHGSVTSSVAGGGGAGAGDCTSASDTAAAVGRCNVTGLAPPPCLAASRGRSASRERGGDGGDASADGGGSGSRPPPSLAPHQPPPLPWGDDPFWQVQWDDLRPALVRKIGSGSFGQVYEAFFRNAAMAVKIISLDSSGGDAFGGDGDENGAPYTPDPAVLARFKDEVDLQRRLSLHPNIVRFLGACYHVPVVVAAPVPAQPTSLASRLGGWRRCRTATAAAAAAAAARGSAGGDSGPTTPPAGALATHAAAAAASTATLAIIMELCRLGSLFRLLEYARRVARLPPAVRTGTAPPRTPDEARLRTSPGWRLWASWPTRLAIAQQVAAAVAFMHEQHVLHRDLTSYNILCTDKWEAKVGDFNLSRALHGDAAVLPASGAINSPEWSAPERLAGQAYGSPSDVYSFAVVMYELVTLRVPWADGAVDGGGEGSGEAAAAALPGAASSLLAMPQPGLATGAPSLTGPGAGGPGPFRDTAFFVVSSVPRGARPALPPLSSASVNPPLPELPELYDLIRACWRGDPAARPTMQAVCGVLEGIMDKVKRRVRVERAARVEG